MIIRQMSEEDLPRVYATAMSSLDEYYLPEVFSYFLNQWPGGQIVACSAAGKVIGFICGSRLGPDRVGIALLAVERQNRCQGIGSELLATLRRRAVTEGAYTVQLEVRIENKAAIDFYRARGFIIAESLPMFYSNGGDAIRMIGTTVQNS
ncbi:MAG: GNAT family N-acetyltransferase [Candidatus Methanomethylophilaceae archaeon]